MFEKWISEKWFEIWIPEIWKKIESGILSDLNFESWILLFWNLNLESAVFFKFESRIPGPPPLQGPIIDSAEAQMKLNLNEWICTDMNVCWSYPEPIRNINNQQKDYIELG